MLEVIHELFDIIILSSIMFMFLDLIDTYKNKTNDT